MRWSPHHISLFEIDGLTTPTRQKSSATGHVDSSWVVLNTGDEMTKYKCGANGFGCSYGGREMQGEALSGSHQWDEVCAVCSIDVWGIVC